MEEDARLRAAVGLLADDLRELTAHVGVLNTLLRQYAEGADVPPPEHAQLEEDLLALVRRLARLSREFPPPVLLVLPPLPGE